MNLETVSNRKLICMMSLFIFGTSALFGVNKSAGQDAWISLIGAVIFALPVIFIYSRIVKLYPEKNLFDISVELFGKVGGNIINIIMIWYALHLGGMVLNIFTEFIHITALPETPSFPIMLAMMLIVTYAVKCGFRTFGSYTVLMFTVISFIILITVIFSFGQIETENFFPIFNHSYKDILNGSFQALTFPFAEVVLFLMLANFMKKEDKPFKTFFWGTIFAFIILMVILLRNIAVIGPDLMSYSYYPSYTAARLLNFGDFLQRIENTITYNLILAGAVKIVICLIGASLGISKLFGIKEYKNIVFPISLCILAMSIISYSNVMETHDFILVYMYYAIPFQFIIPVLIWITAEIKTRKKKKETQQVQ